MFFFILYSASDSIYRKTSILLAAFTGFFIWTSYCKQITFIESVQNVLNTIYYILDIQ